MEWLNRARKHNNKYYPHWPDTEDCYTLNEIKEELATREHIPNKAEAKELRKQNARAKRNR